MNQSEKNAFVLYLGAVMPLTMTLTSLSKTIMAQLQ